MNLGSPVALKLSYDCWHMISTAKLPSCQPTTSVKALKETQSNDRKDHTWPYPFFIHHMIPEGRIVRHLHQHFCYLGMSQSTTTYDKHKITYSDGKRTGKAIVLSFSFSIS